MLEHKDHLNPFATPNSTSIYGLEPDMLKIFKIDDGLEVAVELIEDNRAPYFYVYFSVGWS
jgi:hypothetical protein